MSVANHTIASTYFSTKCATFSERERGQCPWEKFLGFAPVLGKCMTVPAWEKFEGFAPVCGKCMTVPAVIAARDTARHMEVYISAKSTQKRRRRGRRLCIFLFYDHTKTPSA